MQHILQEIWDEVPDLKPLRVGVALSSLATAEAHQPDLSDKPSDARLVSAIDELNGKFGQRCDHLWCCHRRSDRQNRFPEGAQGGGVLECASCSRQDLARRVSAVLFTT
jgi:hypothetical protein